MTGSELICVGQVDRTKSGWPIEAVTEISNVINPCHAHSGETSDLVLKTKQFLLIWNCLYFNFTSVVLCDVPLTDFCLPHNVPQSCACNDRSRVAVAFLSPDVTLFDGIHLAANRTFVRVCELLGVGHGAHHPAETAQYCSCYCYTFPKMLF